MLQFNQLADNFKYGKSYWKFNNSLCADKCFVDKMNVKIRELKEEFIPQFSDKRLLWDFMKMKMREFIIKFSQARARLRRLEAEKLEKEINELENQLVSAPSKIKLMRLRSKKKKKKNQV